MPTFQFRPTGVCLDLPPEQAPADCWTDVQNLTFPDGPATRPDGEEREYLTASSLSQLPIHVLHAGDDAANISAFQSLQTWWAVGRTVAGVVVVQQFGDPPLGPATRTPTAWTSYSLLGTAPANVTSGRFNGLAYVNVSAIGGTGLSSLAYGTPGASTPLTQDIFAAGQAFRAVRTYKYQLIGMAPYVPSLGNDYTQRVQWSAQAAPGSWPSTWTPAATNEAGSVEVSGARGRLVDGGQLAEDFVLYAENSTHLLTYVGGQTVMALRTISTQAGAIGRNCLADIGPAHFVVTDSDVVLMDANGPKSIADGVVRRHLFGPQGAIARGRAGWVHVIPHYPRKEVWVCYPADDVPHCDRAMVWSMATGKWGERRLRHQHQHGAAGTSRLTNLRHYSEQVTVLGAIGAASALTDGRLYLADEPTTGGVYATLSAHAYRHDLDMGEPGRVKRVTAVRPRFRQVAGTVAPLEVRAGGRNSATEAISWSSWRNYSPATDDTVHLTGATGRLIAVEIRQQNSALPWQLVGLDIDYELRGRW